MSELFPANPIALEVLSCTDPSREMQFNRWYDKVMIPALRQTPGIQSVHRYYDIQPVLDEEQYGWSAERYKWPQENGLRYLTLYRIYSDDPWGTMQKVKEDNQKRVEQAKLTDLVKSWELSVWSFYATRRSTLPPERQPRPPTNNPDGMPEVLLTVADTRGGGEPAAAAVHDDWWLYTHSHDLCEHPGWVQSNRYNSLNPKPAEREATGLNIYELEHDDPAALLTEINKADKYLRRPHGRLGGWARHGPPPGSPNSYLAGIYRHWDIMSANSV